MDYKIVEITWLDAWDDTAYLEEAATENLAPIERRNVGYLIKGDADKVIITSGVINNLYAGKVFIDGVIVIPRSMITEIKVIND